MRNYRRKSITSSKSGLARRLGGLSLDNQLCFTLHATSLAMTKVYRSLLSRLGLTYPQYILMLALWEVSELSVGALGERVALDSGTFVPLVGKLTALGLVERRRSPVDDRSVLISLMPAGRQLSAQRQDHAKAAALGREGRGDRAGDVDSREPGDPRTRLAKQLNARTNGNITS